MAEQNPSSDWIKNGTHQSVDAGGGEDGDLSDMNVVKGVSWGGWIASHKSLTEHASWRMTGPGKRLTRR